MSPAGRLLGIRTLLSQVLHAHLDHLAGTLEQPEAGAALQMRADVGVCLRRAKALAIFARRVPT